MKQIVYSSLFFLQLMLFSFMVIAQDIQQIGNQQPLTINGVFGMGLGTYSSTGIPPRERAFSYLFNGAPVITVYGISFPFSVVVSDQQRGFRQPFNQYGISPTYKWITLHAGWQSIMWSPFTMAGYNILGGGVELNPGKWRLGFVYGRFNKAVEEDPAQPASVFQTPAYERKGYSGKIGYGTERNHFDLIFLNAKDDVNSLKTQPVLSGITPAENLVVGISSKWTLFKHFVWNIDASGSIYTRNVLDDTIQNLELNKLNFIKKLIKINASTQLLTAGQTSIGYQDKNYNVGLQYRRVDPDYKSMGAYYFETDVANYTLLGGWSLFKNIIQLNGSLGFQHDNLLHDKKVTSYRKISSLNVAYNKSSYGIDIRYSNYGITQDRGLNPLIDTFRVARTNYNFNALLRYTISNERLSNNFMLVGTVQSLVDLNHFTSGQDQTNSKTANLSYQLGFTKSAFSAGASYSYTTAAIAGTPTVIYGPSLTFNKQLGKGKMDLNASVSIQQQQTNNKNGGNVFNSTLTGSYRFSKRDGVSLTFIYLKNNSNDVTLPSFTEVRTSLNLTHAF